MLQVVQAFDRAPFAEVPVDDVDAMEAKLEAAFSERLEASTVMINDPTTFRINDPTTFRTDWMPFAGRREAGYGVGGIPYTMRDMTQEKMVVLHRRA